MRFSPESAHFTPPETTERKKPKTLLEKLRSKLLNGTLITVSVLGAGGLMDMPLNAQAFNNATQLHETQQWKPSEPERKVGRQERIDRMRGVLNIFRKSQPKNIDSELENFYSKSLLNLLKEDPKRFTSKQESSRPILLPESIPFLGGTISRADLQEYIKTLPEGWQNSISGIEYSPTSKTNRAGGVEAEVLPSSDNKKTVRFYNATAQDPDFRYALTTISHEIAHVALGQFADYTQSNPDGNIELNQRVLYALMQRLQSPDRFNGPTAANYLNNLKKSNASNYRIAMEYLAIIGAQYIDDPRQLPIEDLRLVSHLIAAETAHFDVIGTYNQRKNIVEKINNSITHMQSAHPNQTSVR